MADFTDSQLRIFEKENIECDDVTELLGDLHDNDLPESLRERVEDHINACEYCRNVRDGYELTISLAKQLVTIDEELPPDVHSRFIRALNTKLGLNLKEERKPGSEE